MLNILVMGICLVKILYPSIKGEKLEWHEMILLVLGVLIFTSMVDNYYI